METIKMTKTQVTDLFQHNGILQRCDVCGNQYDKCFEVHLNGVVYVFDCFECAIHSLAPICAHCGCKIVGHGMEAGGIFYCCAHCAEAHGIKELEDRVEFEGA